MKVTKTPTGLTIDVNWIKPIAGKSGKTHAVTENAMFHPTNITIDGKTVFISVNAFTKDSESGNKAVEYITR